jgi:hypothetical protein
MPIFTAICACVQSWLLPMILIIGMGGHLRAATDITMESVSPAAGTFITGGVLTITVTFDQSMLITVAGNPTLALDSGGVATYLGGTATSNSMDFTYTVAATDTSLALSTVVNPINLNGSTIVESAHPATSADLTLAKTTLPSGGGAPYIINPPAVISTIQVSDAGANYTTGQAVLLAVTFNQSVDVTGQPTMALNSGGTASYLSGSGTAVLTFLNIVSSTDASAGLQCANSPNPIALSGGTVVNTNDSSIAANLTFITAGNLLSSVNGQPATINYTQPATITAISGVQPGGAYVPGNAIDLTVTFSTPVVVSSGTPPSIALNSQGSGSMGSDEAIYASGSGSNILTFHYAIASGNATAMLGYAANPVSLNTSTITNLNDSAVTAVVNLAAGSVVSAANGQHYSISSPAPVTVTGMAVSQANGNYVSGQSLTITVSMSGAVDVAGTPTISLNSGSVASYVSGTGTSALVFSYVIGASDLSALLDVTTATPFALPGGATITNIGTPVTANLTCSTPGAVGSISHGQSISINEATFGITGIIVGVAGGNYQTGSVLPIQVTFSGPVLVSGPTQTIALNSLGTAYYASGSATNTLTFNYTVLAGDYATTLNLTSNSPIALNSGQILDDAPGNAAANLAFTLGTALRDGSSNTFSINGPPIAYLAGGTTMNVVGLTFSPTAPPYEVLLAPSAAVGPTPAAGVLVQNLTITLVDHPDGTAESIGIKTGQDLTAPPFPVVTIGSFDNLTGTIVISSGTASTPHPSPALDGADYATILQSIVYRNANPLVATPGPRTIQFVLTDQNGHPSAVSTATITVSANRPQVFLTGNIASPDNTFSYSQASGGPQLICPAASINNPTPIWIYTFDGTEYNPFWLYEMTGTSNLILDSAPSVLDTLSIVMTNPDGTGIFTDGSESITFTLPTNYAYGAGVPGMFLAFTEDYIDPYPMYSIEPTGPIFSGATSLSISMAGGQNTNGQAVQRIWKNTGITQRFPIPTSVMQTILQSIQYTNSSSNPTQFGTHRQISFIVSNTSTSSPAVTSVAATCTITISPSNVAPVISSTGSYSILEGASNVHLGNQSISDADGNGHNETLTLSVSNGTLHLSGSTTGLTVTGNSSSSIVIVGPLNAGTGLLANAMGNISYTPNPLSNGLDHYVISLNDNGNSSPNGNDPANALTDTVSIPINVTPTNQPPQIIVPVTQHASENASFNFTQSIVVSDPDLNSSGILQVMVTSQHGSLSLFSTTGLSFTWATPDAFGTPQGSVTAGQFYPSMIFRGAISDINNALAQIAYIGGQNFYGDDTISVVVNDLGQSGQWDATPQNLPPQAPPWLAHGPTTVMPFAQSWTVTQPFTVSVAFVNQIPQIVANNPLLVPAGSQLALTGGAYTAPTVYPQLGMPLAAIPVRLQPTWERHGA